MRAKPGSLDLFLPGPKSKPRGVRGLGYIKTDKQLTDADFIRVRRNHLAAFFGFVALVAFHLALY